MIYQVGRLAVPDSKSAVEDVLPSQGGPEVRSLLCSRLDGCAGDPRATGLGVY